MKKVLIMTLLLGLPCAFAIADTIILKNGTRIETLGTWEEGDQIKCFIRGGIAGFPKQDIERIEEGEIENKKDQPPAIDRKVHKTRIQSKPRITEHSKLPRNPIAAVSRSKARSDLKAQLAQKYSGSFSTQKMLLDAGMKDYNRLCALPPNQISNQILSKLKSRYYPSFSTIWMLYESNIKAYHELNR